MKWYTEMKMTLDHAPLDDDIFTAFADARYEIEQDNIGVQDADLGPSLADGWVDSHHADRSRKSRGRRAQGGHRCTGRHPHGQRRRSRMGAACRSRRAHDRTGQRTSTRRGLTWPGPSSRPLTQSIQPYSTFAVP
jgi:hypothetical protein